jgi:hypothetical protein
VLIRKKPTGKKLNHDEAKQLFLLPTLRSASLCCVAAEVKHLNDAKSLGLGNFNLQSNAMVVSRISGMWHPRVRPFSNQFIAFLTRMSV